MPKSPPTQDLNQEPQPTDLYHHSLITTTPDALKYHAATSVQLQFGHNHENPTKPSTLLISSPYNEPAHLLDLTTLDQQSQLLAKALTAFQPTRADYATAAYTESFNWDAVFSFLRELCKVDGYVWAKREFFVVVFRSCIALNADVDRLHELDAKSHQEATASGGLLKYWFGSKNAERENLATCELSCMVLLIRKLLMQLCSRYLAQ